MKFLDNIPIFIQIRKIVEDNILNGILKSKAPLPSIRTIVADFEVNPNTVVKAYRDLQEKNIIIKKRGLGFTISEEAKNIIIKGRRDKFLEEKIPEFITQLKLLDIPLEAIEEEYKKSNSEWVGITPLKVKSKKNIS